MTDATALRTTALVYVAGDKRILGGVDLSISPGELVGVIGPNGAGKTTLLRLMCGLLMPTDGGVLVDAKPLREMSARARARLISFMSQEASHDVGFTAQEVVLMGRYPHLARFQKEGAEDVEIARRALAYVGLGGFEERLFNELSGGEQQLILFARVLAQEARVVLLDEPSSHLDIRHEDTIFSMAQELAGEGRAVVATVHNLNVAAHYCSRLVLLDGGRIAAQGRPEDVLEPEVLTRVYGAQTAVSRSGSTGSLTVSVVPTRVKANAYRIHLIGGAGSAVNLTRELYRLGFTLTGGVAHSQDSDEILWKSLRIECHTVGAFSRIGDDDVEAARHLVENADMVVLCAFPIGVGNVGNLRLARHARRLVIMQEGSSAVSRRFFTNEAQVMFSELGRRAEVVSWEGLLALVAGQAGATDTSCPNLGS